MIGGFLPNYRGDVVALLSATGETVAEWERGPFGEPLLDTASSEAYQAWLNACRIGFGSKPPSGEKRETFRLEPS